MPAPEYYPARTLWLDGVGRDGGDRSGTPRGELSAPPANFKRTISLCMIARGDEPGLPKAVASVRRYVHEVILVLNGTSKQKAVAYDAFRGDRKVKVVRSKWNDDFAEQRNISFKHATGDWLFWIDSDDTVEGAERLQSLIYEAEKRGWGCVQLTYIFRRDEHGNAEVVHNRERLLRRDLRWSWKDRVHEYANAEVVHYVGYSDDVTIVHAPQGIHTDRNLRLLKLMEEENPDYPRMLVALGDCYFSMGEYANAYGYYERYFERAESSVRQWTAAVQCAKCSFKLAQENPIHWQDVVRWAQTAIAIHPEFADPYIYMAHVAWWEQRDAGRVLLWLQQADGLLEAPLEVMRHPKEYTLNRWDVEHRALADQGRWAEALEIIGKALEATNFDDSWAYYGYLYTEANNCEKSLAAATQLVDHLARRGDTLRALKLVDDIVPISLRSDARFHRLKARVHEITAHVFDDAKYQEFYERNHGGSEDLNATDVNLYRMEALDKAFRKRGVRRVLDVGCGAGEPAIWLAQKGYFVTGIDINEHAVEAAKKRAKHAEEIGAIKPMHLEFKHGSLETLGPKELGTFDAVVIMEVIEHVLPSKIPFYFGCADDLLKPGGAVYVTTPNMLVGDIPTIWADFPRDHVTEFTREELEQLVLFPPGRRRLWNLHKIDEPRARVPGFGSWFVEYDKESDADGRPIVIYAGPGLEPWTPDQPETRGLGGSETWAVNVARELRAQGFPVVVYAESDGVWDGVIYRHHSKFDPRAGALGVKPWMLIVSRYIEMMDTKPEADHVLFMAHDTSYGDAVTSSRTGSLDAYLVLSEWHKQHTLELYPWLADKIAITQNGINPEYFEGKEERIPHSFIWSSSPDRGLDYFLAELWPAIRERLPDATLDVFYGFENMDKLAASRPWLGQFKQNVLALARQPGVRLRGRIGQRELAREFMRHEFWVYPSITPFGEDWNETFCITAWEAQVAGCKCLTVDVGALPERKLTDDYFAIPRENFRDNAIEFVKIAADLDAQRASTEGTTWEDAALRILSVVDTEVGDG